MSSSQESYPDRTRWPSASLCDATSRRFETSCASWRVILRQRMTCPRTASCTPGTRCTRIRVVVRLSVGCLRLLTRRSCSPSESRNAIRKSWNRWDMRWKRIHASIRYSRNEVTDLDKLLAVLDEEERAIMIMSYACGLSHREISDATSMPVGSVKSVIFRGKQKIRTSFDIKDHQHG